ncbi:MAG: PHP domain-containing protein [Balneolaceae bacterium]
MGKADLHTHTTASDGSCSPEKIIELASSKSLNTIAITDHDTIKGYLQAIPYAEKHSLRLLPGVEITALWGKREIHILGYCFDAADPGLKKLLRRQRAARTDRMKQIVHQLNKKGVDVQYDEVRAVARTGTIARPHIAEVLIKKKYVASVSEAFIRYLGSSMLELLDIDYAGIEEVIQTLKNAGGASVLAHPGPLYRTEEIEKLVGTGLDGLECIHPAHNFNQQKQYSEWAEKENLLVTGGSDFHGSGTEYHPYFGIVTLSDKRVNDIVSLSSRRKQWLNNDR